MNRNNQVTIGKEVWRELTSIQSLGYSASTVFNDFLDTIIYTLLSFTASFDENIIDKMLANKFENIYEDEYMKLISKYKENQTRERGKRPIDHFSNAWVQLQLLTREKRADILGQLYMEQITHGEHGQFFTPTHITEMMAKMVGANNEETVSDPCCGSGRFFIAMSKLNSNASFHGVDLSLTCAKMTVLNMWLFDLNADIYQGDSLTMQMNQVWRIRKGGWVFNQVIEN